MRRFIRPSHLTRRFSKEAGTALAELAIVLPLVMLLLLGMLDFGNAYNTWIDSTHLANEGARLAAVNYQAPTCTLGGTDPTGGLACYISANADLKDIRSGRVGDSYAPAQNPAQVCISFPPVSGHTTPLVGDPVQITVTTNYKWLHYITSRLNIATTAIKGTAVMRLEGTPSNYSAGCYTPPGP
jgi:hypothetical protein